MNQNDANWPKIVYNDRSSTRNGWQCQEPGQKWITNDT